MNEKTGLYIHIPYCFSPCGYCDFYKTRGENVEEDYIDSLIREAELYKEEKRFVLDSIYFGGGTPSLLEPFQLERILAGLNGVFDLSENPEFTIESNPETITADKLRGYKKLGVNRLSIGIQSLSDKTLSLLSRNVKAGEILAKLKIIGDCAFDHLSCDMIIGAPGSSVHDVAEDLERLLEFPFDHVSLYMLELHKGMKLYNEVGKGLALPSEEEVMESYELAAEFLGSKDLIHYEISNFAKMGCESRHNLRYWKGQWTLALGPSAHGYFRDTRMKNPRSMEEWKSKLGKSEFPYEEAFKETKKEKLENAIIFGLRLREGVEFGLLSEYLEESEAETEKRISPILKHGYGEIVEDRFRLTLQGFCLSNEIIAFLLPGSFRWHYGSEEER
jgi:oxygen-independent coproporphyrinogen III oxidase